MTTSQTEEAAPVRAFLAAAPSNALRAALAARIEALRAESWGSRVRWVRTGSLHLTLRFLGDLAPAQLESIADRVEGVARRHAPCAVPALAIEAFPSASKPRVIAVRFGSEPALDALAADLEEAAVACGLAPETRRFRPHLTLGRVRGSLPRQAATRDASWTALAALEGHRLEVDAVVLYRSDLARSGARYTALAHFDLTSTAGGLG